MACLTVVGLGIPPGFGPRRGLCRPPGGVLFRCRLRGDDTGSGGREEPLESLFAKELKRRGIDPASSPEDSRRSRGSFSWPMEEMDLEEEQNGARGPLKRNRVVSADHEESLADQWARSMALNSEGLEGLIPRARLLLTTGATFFLGFWPLVIITIGLFSATDYYFGPGFVHEAHKTELSGTPAPPQDGTIAPRVE